MEKTKLSMVVKELRKEYGLTQEDLAMKSGVGLCFVRNLEQGKPTLRMDKVNQLLDLFNYELTATKKQWNKQKYTEKKSLQAESDEMQKCTDMAKQDEADVDEYIRRLKSYAGAEELTRQMALDLIEYITIDENPRKKAIPRDIHIYYKLIDKPLKNKNNALAEQAGAIKKWSIDTQKLFCWIED